MGEVVVPSNNKEEHIHNENTIDMNEDVKQSVPKPAGLVFFTANIFGIRHVQMMLYFTGLMVAYSLRVNLSVAIVAMVDNSSNRNFEQYNWDESTQGLVLSSFFWGYIISQVPAGILAQTWGPRIIMLISTIIYSSLTILTPLFASQGWELLCVIRVIEGLAQGTMYPCVHTLLSKWVHPSERGFLNTFTYSGTQAGTVVMMAVSGILAESVMGWPSIFYFSGGVGLLWCFFWYAFGSNSPSESKLISNAERQFIESMPGSSSHKQTNIPWRHILTSKPFLVLALVHSTHNWGFWTLLTEIPKYMKNILNFDIKSNALLSALPYFVMWLLSLIMSPISDCLINKGCVSVGTGRKLFNTIGHWVPMFALIVLSFITHGETALAVVLLTIAVGINSGTYVGFMVNHMDLSPNFSGPLMGVTNAVGNVMSLLGPLVVGFIVSDATDPLLWRIVFLIAAGFYFFGNLLFIIFGQATIQPWNYVNEKKDQLEQLPSKEMSESTNTLETVDIKDINI